MALKSTPSGTIHYSRPARSPNAKLGAVFSAEPQPWPKEHRQ